MAAAFPYTHYACPCSDLTSGSPLSVPSKRSSIIQQSQTEPTEERSFNPHDPRANYSLYPLENLLFCDECDGIRCSRCWTEEVINWYCPSCLFEVPSSAVKSDGNRCSRNCYDCPVCTSPLAVTAMPQPVDGHLKPGDSADEAYMLLCQYCDWSSLDVGARFSKPTKITEQLVKLRKARVSTSQKQSPTTSADVNEVFDNITNFYKEQLNESGDPQNPYSNSPYSSPANLARIMSLYGGLSSNALKKSREKPQPMREARDQSEGLLAYSADSPLDEKDMIRRLQASSWEETAAAEQRFAGPPNYDVRFTSELWPVATKLRTRKGKRCRACRQFLSRPDAKVSNMRYKIRLLALNNVPRLSLRPLQAPAQPPPHSAFQLRPAEPAQALLQPQVPQQYVLTVRNPIFESVKITLATPGVTPGKVTSRVTILCPAFTVGPAGDVWDEALSTSTSSTNDGSRRAAMASLTGKSEDTDRQPEAGKVWDQTRSSTSVIVEIVPGQLKPPPSIVPKSEAELANEEPEEDDDVLEVPLYVRAEWEAVEEDASSTRAQPSVSGDKEERRKGPNGGEKVKKELAYWCVLGVGRIAG